MSNRGVYGSLSSVPVEMGAGGAVYMGLVT